MYLQMKVVDIKKIENLMQQKSTSRVSSINQAMGIGYFPHDS